MGRQLFLILALLTFVSASARADIFERFLMPGPLHNAHAKLENKCENCHEPFDKSLQRRLCLDCHKDVSADISGKSGFHGRTDAAVEGECKQCHTEHKGRDANILQFDPDTFDHRTTDFALKGAHGRVACQACHVAGKNFREAPSQCINCHRADEPHKGRLGEECASCHSNDSWRSGKFDHGKTKFPLDGGHRDVACDSCHPNQQYKKIATECVSCHRLNDVHGGQYGTKCESCHKPNDWKSVSFDHDKETKFPLTGAHKTAACVSCHVGGLYKQELQTTCFACHKFDDEHKGRNGTRCDTCHSPKSWQAVSFDHAKDTAFPLRGKHADLTCESCHWENAYKQKLGTDCISCHKRQDPHRGQQGAQCGNCHNEQGWRVKVFFDHDLTKFPLIGLHATAPCEACHASAQYKDASIECSACHKADDKHEGTLGPACGACHNPNGWSFWRFDHNTQTDFKLDGGHAGLACESCHKIATTASAKLPKSCSNCHRGDDPHHGSFGQQCGKCHTTTSFRDVKFRR